MPSHIDFYFDFISPYSYLASIALPRLAADHRIAVRHHPFDLVELMKRVGNRPTTLECANKGAYVTADVRRWAAHYQVALTPNPHWKTIDYPAVARTALVALDDGVGPACITALFAALWVEAADLSQPGAVAAVLDRAGLPGARLFDRAGAPEYLARLDGNTRAAADRGCFGSPTMFIGDQMFFGNDRFDFMAQALRAPITAPA
jgi:2-hydroxychromene-2-carboxylate isomerase